MEAVCSSETLAYACKTKKYHNAEDWIRSCENVRYIFSYGRLDVCHYLVVWFRRPLRARTGAALADASHDVPRLGSLPVGLSRAGSPRSVHMQGDGPENVPKLLHTFQAARSEILIPPNSPQSAVSILTQPACCCSLNASRCGAGIGISSHNTVGC
jgi:hypothetical protein